ncbi:hypothetical protein Aph01nite_62410 [Acrocarpospora phusangensis]|uniref:Uncharacterized protein n=2 Tax=Acrocarpospora phusangensis TaxID=1070424 RepID=A0A919UN02_9ACTN|nr:hypothetical protein Aph01nite_62410 [Acrocarpospora phusangensis]
MDTARTEHAITLHMAEYDRLKAEQVSRIGFRDNLLYAQLTSVAAIAAVAASAGRLYLLLVIPITGVVLGWTHLCADHMVTMIGRYIREDLTARLTAAADLDGTDDSAVFGWEHDHHRDVRRRSRKWFQLTVNLFAFCLPSLTGLTLVWIAGRPSPLVIAVSLVELLIVVVLAVQMGLYAELPRRGKGGACA